MNSLRRGLLAAAVVAALGIMFGCGSGPQQTNFDATITGPADSTVSLTNSMVGGPFGFPAMIFIVTNPDGTPVPNAEVTLTPANSYGATCLVTSGGVVPGTFPPLSCVASRTLAADNEGKVKVDFYVDTPSCDSSCAPIDQTVAVSVLGEVGTATDLSTATITVKSCKSPLCP